VSQDRGANHYHLSALAQFSKEVRSDEHLYERAESPFHFASTAADDRNLASNVTGTT
jgi:hypothetical protein